MNTNAARLRLIKIVIMGLCCTVLFIAEATTVYAKKTQQSVQQNDPVPAQKVITLFLQWYKANLKKANSFPILIKDSNDYFMVNKRAVADYLHFMKSSKCLSAKYIAYWKTYFNDKAIQLEKEKIQSDIPEGFDFDFVLITQEPELVLNQVNRIKFKTVSINSTVALIGLKWPVKNSMQYEFEMYKSKDGWQIGYISTPNFD